MKKQKKTDRTFDWFIKTDFSQYAGKWIALVNEEVAAVGDNAKAVLKEAKKKFPHSLPALVKVPKAELMVLLQILWR
ncbi:MAG: DUF5678 domain-containing protein [Candidatus Edwardsbacteria bacterium]